MPGKFSFQFILDGGAEEYVVRPTVQDAEVVLKPVQASESLYFDTDRQVLIPSSLKWRTGDAIKTTNGRECSGFRRK